MPLTVTIGDELADQLGPYQAELSEILRLGIREWRARGENGYAGLSDVIEKLASLPAPQDVLALRPAPVVLDRLETLLEKNRMSGWSAEEKREWEQYQYVEHLVRLAKASAACKLKENKSA
jgi:hypothetical protein